MNDPGTFSLANPATWIPSAIAGVASLYGIYRAYRRATRNDRQQDSIDGATQQIIATLRAEVDRLTGRMEKMEQEIIRLHEERASLLNKIAGLQPPANAPQPA